MDTYDDLYNKYLGNNDNLVTVDSGECGVSFSDEFDMGTFGLGPCISITASLELRDNDPSKKNTFARFISHTVDNYGFDSFESFIDSVPGDSVENANVYISSGLSCQPKCKNCVAGELAVAIKQKMESAGISNYNVQRKTAFYAKVLENGKCTFANKALTLQHLDDVGATLDLYEM